jgi:hypothetical protein
VILVWYFGGRRMASYLSCGNGLGGVMGVQWV